jgi:hypothetical protein
VAAALAAVSLLNSAKAETTFPSPYFADLNMALIMSTGWHKVAAALAAVSLLNSAKAETTFPSPYFADLNKALIMSTRIRGPVAAARGHEMAFRRLMTSTHGLAG